MKMKRLLYAGLCGVLHAQDTPPLSFETLLAHARPSTLVLRADADWAQRHRELSTSGGFLREGPTVSLEAGPRTRPASPGTTDKAVQVDLPLALNPGKQGDAEDKARRAEPLALLAARLESRLALRRAYLDAWQDQVDLDLRRAQVDLSRRWLAVAQQRVEAGADPGFQLDLVRADVLRSETDMATARRRAAESWSRLRTQAEIGEQPRQLADPGEPSLTVDSGQLRPRFESGTLRRALASQSESDASLLDLRQSLKGARWSLRGSHAREGEERITRVGVAFRFPRPGEARALSGESQASRAALRLESEVARITLEGRFQAALDQSQSVKPSPASSVSIREALHAVDLRLQEGKERPSDALLLRRQLLDGQISLHQRLHDTHLLTAELDTLTAGDQP